MDLSNRMRVLREFHNGNAIAATPDKDNKDAYFFHIMLEMIFVLFNEKPWNRMQREAELPDRILVFGWDGSPSKIYSLDQGIINFCC